MLRRTRLLAAAFAVFFASSALAVDVNEAHVLPADHVPNDQPTPDLIVQLIAPSTDYGTVVFAILPLTTQVGVNQTAQTNISIPGDFVLANLVNYANITSKQIAYLSCDETNTTNISTDDMFVTIAENKPAAILLYSRKSSCCDLRNTGNLKYQTVFTMADNNSASQAFTMTNSDKVSVQAVITTNDTDTLGGDNKSGMMAIGKRSAIAMSILYSITGLITLLFLFIIGSGALRARRYPERYGPRNGQGGRPRQSRAKGIARAVLDTLPIVKFGSPSDPSAAKQDPNVELESSPDRQHNVAGDRQAHHLSTIPEDAEAQPKAGVANRASTSPSTDTGSSGSRELTGSAGVSAGAGVLAESSETTTTPSEALGFGAEQSPANDETTTSQSVEDLGCSICTEDFTVGEDVRVLPCRHKFHPHCVDPWLINVSGTCPLCRLDLRPQLSGEELDSNQVDDQAHMPPPLETEEAGHAAEASAAASAAAHPHRTSRYLDINRLRHASTEERIEVLRRYRAANAPRDSAGEDEQSRAARLTRRLMDKFRVRTRAQLPSSLSRN